MWNKKIILVPIPPTHVANRDGGRRLRNGFRHIPPRGYAEEVREANKRRDGASPFTPKSWMGTRELLDPVTHPDGFSEDQLVALLNM